MGAIRGVKPSNELASRFGVHPTQISQWNPRPSLFWLKNGPKIGEHLSPACQSGRETFESHNETIALIGKCY